MPVSGGKDISDKKIFAFPSDHFTHLSMQKMFQFWKICIFKKTTIFSFLATLAHIGLLGVGLFARRGK